jgi:nicotinate phosphoribosyltransferase
MPLFTQFSDDDFYKFTMGQNSFFLHQDIEAVFKLIVRNKDINLKNHIDEGELREELDYARTVRMQKNELDFLAGIRGRNGEPLFKKPYLKFLENFQLTPYELDMKDGINLTFSGPWYQSTYWEIPAMTIVKRLYIQSFLKEMSAREKEEIYEKGMEKLKEKLRVIATRPSISITEFGTRRRESLSWQSRVIETLMEMIPNQLSGTSNVYLAMKYGIPARGTMAHERDMALAAVMSDTDEGILRAICQGMDDWNRFYGGDLSIALPDTFGTDIYLRLMPLEYIQNWDGFRQDSGNPFLFGNKIIDFYLRNDVDAKVKRIMFSDGLKTKMIMDLEDYFHGRIQIGNGWGTDLTCDLGFPDISMIIKLILANRRGAVKLSDNIAKAIGRPEDIERYKRVVGYSNTFSESPTY